MRATRFILVSLLSLAFVSPALPKQASAASEAIPGTPCAAFAQDGHWATATFTPEALQVRIGDPSGKSRSYGMFPVLKQGSPLSDFPGCRLFFSPDGRYLAIDEDIRAGNSTTLRIGVLDSSTGEWTSSFEVRPQGSMQTHLELAGFLQNTQVLVVTGENAANSRGRTTSTTSMMYDLEGKILQSPGEARADPADLEWTEADAKHNRLWGFGAGTSVPCHWRSVALTGAAVQGPTFGIRAVGNVACSGFFFAFPDGNTVIGASDLSNHGWAWRVDLPTNTGEKLQLPESEPVFRLYRNWYNVRRGSLSPDGQVFVIDRDLARDVFDRFYQQPNVLTAVQVRPLRVLGTIQLKGACPVRALAVDHRNGQSKALIYTCGQWEGVSIPPVSPK